MTKVRIEEGETLIEALLKRKELANGDVLELYKDEAVLHLLKKQADLKADLKKIDEVLKLVDKEAIKRLRRRNVTTAEDDEIKVTLVSYSQRSVDKDKLGEYLSTQGKSLEEFEEIKKVEYVRRKLK